MYSLRMRVKQAVVNRWSLLLRRDFMDVLVLKGVNIDSIDECVMDFDSNFISYTDEEVVNVREGSNFIVLYENYFHCICQPAPPKAAISSHVE
jgi:hypothetical protein